MQKTTPVMMTRRLARSARYVLNCIANTLFDLIPLFFRNPRPRARSPQRRKPKQQKRARLRMTTQTTSELPAGYVFHCYSPSLGVLTLDVGAIWCAF
jgi:hypothetical protein